ncbi:MAG TPA: serine hydrolase domain-containing protein [Sphingomicrobium sp.]
MTRFSCLAVTVALFAAPVAAQSDQQNSAAPGLADLSGLWAAKKWFGPDVRGPLIIERTSQGLRADIAGRTAKVTRNGQELSFELPGGEGSFSGRFESPKIIRGHWIRGLTAISYGRSASPVVLTSVGPGHWSGTVDPGEEDFSFYIFARKNADGSYAAVLRNPEFDLGNQRGARRLIRDGDSVQLMAARGDAPERALAAGRIELDMEGFSLTFPGRGGTYDFTRGDNASLVYPRPRPGEPYHYVAPPWTGDGWPASTLKAEGIDQPAMERLVQSIIDMKMDEADAPEIHALLITRHGRLVLEEYFHGFSRDELHTLRSAGKSISGAVIGAAMHAGAPIGLDSRVYQLMNGGAFPPGLEPRKRAMTLENLLTMSSGHYCDDTDDKAPGNEDHINDDLQPPNVVGYFMSVPMVTDPGANSVYCSMQPHLALAMLAEATHESPLRIFDRLVARPMQITDYSWPLDANGRPYGGGSVALRARDFMKFGQLMLNGGVWKGRRILDASYAKAIATPQYHLRNVFYSYLWWVEYYPYKNRKVLGYSARGAGGQLVFVVPELDLVVTTMGGNYSNRRGGRYLNNFIATSILPAVREAGDDLKAPVKDLDWASPYGASKDGSRVSAPR